MNYIFFSVFLLLLSSCTSAIKYGINKPVQPTKESVKNSFEHFSKKYVSLINDDTIERACKEGFLYSISGNKSHFYIGDNTESTSDFSFDSTNNNDLEIGLEYIFINTLRLKLSSLDNKDKNNYSESPWVNVDEENVDEESEKFVCPKPWKYIEKDISGKKRSIFYLPCVQMGEYHYDNVQKQLRKNYEIVKNYNKSGFRTPYMNLSYPEITGSCLDANYYTETCNSMILNIDHVVHDNKYLAELPKNLHNWKTSVLDPMIRYESQTVRDFNAGIYWNERSTWEKSFSKTEKNKFSVCDCKNKFDDPISMDDDYYKHDHKKKWKNDWEPKMRKNHVLMGPKK